MIKKVYIKEKICITIIIKGLIMVENGLIKLTLSQLRLI